MDMYIFSHVEVDIFGSIVLNEMFRAFENIKENV
jgi:hypothetical protein